ncbi:hypothetical protein DIPPA_33368, partial [Diplonema papillatum]
LRGHPRRRANSHRGGLQRRARGKPDFERSRPIREVGRCRQYVGQAVRPTTCGHVHGVEERKAYRRDIRELGGGSGDIGGERTDSRVDTDSQASRGEVGSRAVGAALPATEATEDLPCRRLERDGPRGRIRHGGEMGQGSCTPVSSRAGGRREMED